MTTIKGFLKNKLTFLFSLLVLLTGCGPKVALAPNPSPASGRGEHIKPNETIEVDQQNGSKTVSSTSTAAITSWEISGGIAAKGPQEAWTASFNWVEQSPHNYQLRLIGPLGGKTILIKQNSGQVTYQEGQRLITAKSAESLLYKETGIKMPVASLYYWSRGLPAPSAPHSFKNISGVNVLNQSGYTIAYLNYKVVNGIKLPTKIHLQGQGVMIKLAIRQWSF